MPKTKEQKKQIVSEIEERLPKSNIVILTSFTRENEGGTNVSQMQELRKNLKHTNAEYFVSKKTLINVALNRASYSGLVNMDELQGSIGIVFGYGDVAAISKVVYGVSKANDSLKLLGALMNKEFLNSERLIALAKLPSREAMLGQMVGMVKYPISGLINVLQGNLRNLVLVLSNIKST